MRNCNQNVTLRNLLLASVTLTLTPVTSNLIKRKRSMQDFSALTSDFEVRDRIWTISLIIEKGVRRKAGPLIRTDTLYPWC
ncbi:hypothetical protein DPMN_058813 [Dreissena polymorpha]|uniref:Uncharacterized protein n=1 Tax=Dreissena polymorpha TaxID=45954 RepID=A0A9D4C2F6_DREPO|nr:hypothetical protein DPMN_058813 [Dreissena polymorpha]